MTPHVIFDQAGVYSPTICPRAVLWRRDESDNPLYGVFVPTPQNAQRFADVTVVEGGVVTKQLLYKEDAL